MTAMKIGLLIEPAWKSVWSVTGSGFPRCFTPNPLAHSIRPLLTTAILTPGGCESVPSGLSRLTSDHIDSRRPSQAKGR